MKKVYKSGRVYFGDPLKKPKNPGISFIGPHGEVVYYVDPPILWKENHPDAYINAVHLYSNYDAEWWERRLPLYLWKNRCSASGGPARTRQ